MKSSSSNAVRCNIVETLKMFAIRTQNA